MPRYAAALALPLALAGGPSASLRAHLIALTFGVIFVTLVGQGLSLIPLIGWPGLSADGTPEQERQHARLEAAQAALTRLQDLAQEAWVSETQLMDLRAHYEEKARHANQHVEGTPHEEHLDSYKRLLREVIQAQRAALITLRDQRQIDDEILRELERELDLEEQRVLV